MRASEPSLKILITIRDGTGMNDNIFALTNLNRAGLYIVNFNDSNIENLKSYN